VYFLREIVEAMGHLAHLLVYTWRVSLVTGQDASLP
jgi:hypothetical protein